MQCGGALWVPGAVCLPGWTGESWNEIRKWLLISQPSFRHPLTGSAPKHSGHAAPRQLGRESRWAHCFQGPVLSCPGSIYYFLLLDEGGHCKNCSGWMKLLGQAVESDLDDAIPKLQLLGDKHKTFGMGCRSLAWAVWPR